MVDMSCYIELGAYKFEYTNGVQIQSAWNSISTTGTLKMPNLKGLLFKRLKVGDPVRIDLGYDGKLTTRFVGYIKEMKPTLPMTLELEDEMWQLKQQEIAPNSWDNASLKDVLTYIVPEADIDVPQVNLGEFRIAKGVKNKADVLKQIKDQYGLAIYYRLDKLFVGLPYTEPAIKPARIRFRTNAPEPKNLVFKRKEDVKIWVKAIALKANNQRLTYEFGDKGGETHTLHFGDLTEAQLKQQAEALMERLRYDGYRGSFVAFGLPVIEHGAIVTIEDPKYPERTGDYLVDKVQINYSKNTGYRQTVTLGKKAA